MRLLLVSQYFWPENFGINALAKSLQERGIEVTVLSGMPNYPEGSIFPGYPRLRVLRGEYEGVETIRMPIIPRGRKSALGLVLNYLSFIISGLLLGPWLLRGRSFDAVFVYAPSPLLQALPAIFLAWLKSAQLVVWVQDLWPESLSATGFVKNVWVLALVKRIVRFIYRRTDGILMPSEGFREPIAAMSIDEAKLHYFPNAWVDSEADGADVSFATTKLVEEVAADFSVLFAGNLGTAQALDTVLDAAELLQRQGLAVRFFLVGSGSLSDWLARQVNDRGLHNVVLTGRLPANSMLPLYAAASALLVSLRDEPIFALTIPSKVQGYLAAGRPIIASLNGEGARIVELAGAGLTCPAGDANALAGAVAKLYALAPATRMRMGQSGCEFAHAHFSLQTLSGWLQQHLDKLVAERGVEQIKEVV
jgi:glycosyltransferase involved in cell wall biosynthesis